MTTDVEQNGIELLGERVLTEEYLLSHAAFKRIWREELHPRDAHGRFTDKLDVFKALLEFRVPGFNPARVNQSLDREDSPSLGEALDRFDGQTASGYLDDPELKRLLNRTALAFDTKKHTEQTSALTPEREHLKEAKAEAMIRAGKELGFTDDQAEAAVQAMDGQLDHWTMMGNLGEGRAKIHDAMMHLRAGGRPDDDLTRGLLLQKVWTDMIWQEEHGDADDVELIRYVQGEYAEAILAAQAVHGDDWSIDSWPLSSWATPRAGDSIERDWVFGAHHPKAAVKLTRTFPKEEVWISFEGEASLRTKNLKAPGEYVPDDRAELSPASGLQVEEITDPSKESAAYRLLFGEMADRGFEPDEVFAALELMRGGHPPALMGFPEHLRDGPNHDQDPLAYKQTSDIIPKVESDRYWTTARRASTPEALEAAVSGTLDGAELRQTISDARLTEKLRDADPETTTISGTYDSYTLAEIFDMGELPFEESDSLTFNIAHTPDTEQFDTVAEASKWVRETGITGDESQLLRIMSRWQGEYENNVKLHEHGWLQLMSVDVDFPDPEVDTLKTSSRYSDREGRLRVRPEWNRDDLIKKRDESRQKILRFLRRIDVKLSEEELARFYQSEGTPEPPETYSRASYDELVGGEALGHRWVRRIEWVRALKNARENET